LINKKIIDFNPIDIQPTSSLVFFFNIDVGLDLNMIDQSKKEEEQTNR
jgi:hypothetical protein